MSLVGGHKVRTCNEGVAELSGGGLSHPNAWRSLTTGGMAMRSLFVCGTNGFQESMQWEFES
ncbi:hypothetical protein LguiA_019369 [Lonicera macranthoides]